MKYSQFLNKIRLQLLDEYSESKMSALHYDM